MQFNCHYLLCVSLWRGGMCTCVQETREGIRSPEVTGGCQQEPCMSDYFPTMCLRDWTEASRCDGGHCSWRYELRSVVVRGLEFSPWFCLLPWNLACMARLLQTCAFSNHSTISLGLSGLGWYVSVTGCLRTSRNAFGPCLLQASSLSTLFPHYYEDRMSEGRAKYVLRPFLFSQRPASFFLFLFFSILPLVKCLNFPSVPETCMSGVFIYSTKFSEIFLNRSLLP